MKNIWKTLGYIVAFMLIVIAGAIGNGVGKHVVSSSPRIDIDNVIRQASAEMNKTLPRMVDRDTRLDSTVAAPGRKLIYLYTLVSVTSTEVTQGQLHSALFETLKNGVCTAERGRFYMDNGANIVYMYRGSDGGIIGELVISPSDCK